MERTKKRNHKRRRLLGAAALVSVLAVLLSGDPPASAVPEQTVLPEETAQEELIRARVLEPIPEAECRETEETEKPETMLVPESVVSMNYWGFMPSIFPELRAYFERFLRGVGGRALKSECLLPVMVDDLMGEDRLRVSVLRSRDKWFGMTYQEDRAVVAEELRKLHENGTYPDSLRE